MLNRVQLIGFLGANPELRYTPEREAIARVRIATSETWKKNGVKQERTEWHNLVFFGKLAEIVGEHLKKGAGVYVEGRLQTRIWDKDGETRYATEIFADVMKSRYRARMGIVADKDGNEKLPLVQPDPAAQREREDLRERVKVLERIVTDGRQGRAIAEAIENLRNQYGGGLLGVKEHVHLTRHCCHCGPAGSRCLSVWE